MTTTTIPQTIRRGPIYRGLPPVRPREALRRFPLPVAIPTLALAALVGVCDMVSRTEGNDWVRAAFVVLGLALLGGFAGLWNRLCDFLFLRPGTRTRKAAAGGLVFTLAGLAALAASFYVRWGYRLDLPAMERLPFVLAVAGVLALLCALLVANWRFGDARPQ